MSSIRDDFGIFEKLQLEFQPVGVKYLTRKPENVNQIAGNMTLCEMLKKALEGESFYASADNHTCDAGTYVLGQTEIKEQYINGEYGAGLEVFKDTRSASRLYHYVPHANRNVIKFIELAPLSKINFDPDLLIIFARTSQAEIILRASSYRTGQMWSSRYSSAIGCSWVFMDPYLRGAINFGTTGLGFGMKRRHLFPEGLQWISVPFNVLPSLLQSLNEMPWIPRAYQPDGPEFVKQLRIRLGLDNP
ncbi:MAG: DUF169 domain-containing protein [Dehalococcoidales bacterium]|jgi:uncharacterized protein (DUF169 family)|nr:DUF169 domain-containing protein [Dehalococcoidales bacterium]